MVSPATRPHPAAPARLLTLSAATPTALDEATDRLVGHLESHPDFARLTRDLQAQTQAKRFRRVVVAAEAAEAAHYLRKRDRRRVFTAQADPARPVVFLFSGVGDQYPGLAGGPYQHLSAFRRELDRCFQLLRPEVGVDLHSILYEESAQAGGPAGGQGRPDKAAMFDQRRQAQAIHRTLVAQPLIFAVQYAMAGALRALGVNPSVLLGYSIGEYVAACLAQVLPLESALRLVALRARLVTEVPEGAMLAVMSQAQLLEPYLDDRVCVAAMDGPRLTVLAGPPEDVDRVAERLTHEGIACRQLPTSHAFHSSMMEPAVKPLHDLLSTFTLKPPVIPVLSNATGTWIRAEEATSPGYWARHLRQTVRFAEDLAEVWKLTAPILIELGPGRALGQLAMQSQPRPAGEAGTILHTLPGPFDTRGDMAVLLDALGRLWATGVEVKFSELCTELPSAL